MGEKVDAELLAKHFGGAVCRQMVRCGKEGCRCSRGELHGPYHYLFYRDGGGRLRKLYVRRSEAEAVAAASAAARGRRREGSRERRGEREQSRDRAGEAWGSAEREAVAGLSMEERVRRKVERIMRTAERILCGGAPGADKGRGR